MFTLNEIELNRQNLQTRLDASKTQAERNRAGQFATPMSLATQMLNYAKMLLDGQSKIRFLDPAFGTGSFYSALLQSFPPTQLEKCVGYEIDPFYGQEAIKLWHDKSLQIELADFTRSDPPLLESLKANLIICNPPYVRHHYLASAEKIRLQQLTQQITGLKLSGLAGLYCYFLCLSHAWLVKDGLAGWLIPSEFLDVNYGQQIKEYLLTRVTLLQIHRFEPNDLQFEDALVSSAIVWFRNTPPTTDHRVGFSFGGTLAKPKTTSFIPLTKLSPTNKWSGYSSTRSTSAKTLQLKLSELFEIKRGVATGANNFFIVKTEEAARLQIPAEFLLPILPGPRYLLTDEIEADHTGNPTLPPHLFLLNCRLPESTIKSNYPMLWKYLQTGIEAGLNERYLCKQRSLWYIQEKRPPAPFLCTYMGRQSNSTSRPFRFILNRSKATAPNVYSMMYPKPILENLLKRQPDLVKMVWQALNEISFETLTQQGRVYGGGLYKMEPRELANVPVDSLLAILPSDILRQPDRQLTLF